MARLMMAGKTLADDPTVGTAMPGIFGGTAGTALGPLAGTAASGTGTAVEGGGTAAGTSGAPVEGAGRVGGFQAGAMDGTAPPPPTTPSNEGAPPEMAPPPPAPGGGMPEQSAHPEGGGMPPMRPPMPSSATPMMAGTFLRPGQSSSAMAPFRSPQFGAQGRQMRFGPGSPISALGDAMTFGEAAGGGGQPNLEELLAALASRGA